MSYEHARSFATPARRFDEPLEERGGPGLQRFEAMVEAGTVAPAQVAELVTDHGPERDAILGHAHARFGNGFVGQVLDELAGADVAADEEPPAVAAPVTDLLDEDPAREPDLAVPEDAFDAADAEAWNRAHVRNVVRFDRATGGAFAKRNGELDASGVADWQRSHGLAAIGRADDATCDVAEGKAPAPQPTPHPQLALLLPMLPPQTIDELIGAARRDERYYLSLLRTLRCGPVDRNDYQWRPTWRARESVQEQAATLARLTLAVGFLDSYARNARATTGAGQALIDRAREAADDLGRLLTLRAASVKPGLMPPEATVFIREIEAELTVDLTGVDDDPDAAGVRISAAVKAKAGYVP